MCRSCHRGRSPDALISRQIHVQTLEQTTIDGGGLRSSETYALGACGFDLPLRATFAREGFVGRRFKTDLQTGDALFDDAISVGGADRDLLPALLRHEPVRLAVMDLVAGALVEIADGQVTAREVRSPGDLDELRLAVTVVAWGMARVGAARQLRRIGPPMLFASALTAGERHISVEIHGDRVDLRVAAATETPALAVWDAHLTSPDLSPLLALPALWSLKLVRIPEVRDLGPIGQLSELKSLVLAGCPVHDIAPLARLHRLQALNLARTQVEDLRPLAALEELRELHLSPERIEDARALVRELPRLQLHGGG